ncbi:TonB-dependent receptor [Aurantivibrio plasticivorans]
MPNYLKNITKGFSRNCANSLRRLPLMLRNCVILQVLLLPHITSAQSSDTVLDEVIVTAERREGNLQDVAIAVSALSSEELSIKQVDNIGDLQSLVPNLSVHVGDANNAVVYIRGIGQIDSIAFFEPGVGIYLDDVYLGRAQGAFLDVIDVERVEVLRGPQGSLYGRNTIGGAIKYVSTLPTDEFSGNALFTSGDYGRRDFKATVAGPLASDRVRGRFTVAHMELEGYAKNTFDGGRDGDRDTDFARGVLEFDITDNINLLLAADYSNNDPKNSRTPSKETPITIPVVDPYTFGVSVQTYQADEDPFTVNADFNTTEFTETKGFSANATWDISDTLTFKSISAYRNLDYGTELDLDATPINAFSIFYFNEQEQTSQEFQLNYTSDSASLVTGAYFFQEDGSTFDGGAFGNFLIGFAGEADFKTTSYAVFGQLDFDFTENLTGIIGFRYTEEEKEYYRIIEDFDLTALAGIAIDGVTGDVSYANESFLTPRAMDLQLGGPIGIARPAADPDPASFDNFSPKLGIKYSFSDDTNLYATFSTSFKSGGFNGRLADGQLEPYDEETLTSYEAGLKTTLANNRVRLNTAIFYNDYKDLQVSSFEATEDGSSLLPVFTNAGEAVMQGLEVEMTTRITEEITLNANLGYLDAEYKEFFAGSDPVTNTAIDVSDDREIVNAPKWDALLGITYYKQVGELGYMTLSGDLSYRSKTYLEVNSSETLAQDAYSVFNALLSFETMNESWRFTLAGKNLTDEEYRTHAFDLSAFPGVELGYYNAPRTYSVNVLYKF